MARRVETRLKGPVLIEPDVFGDERGFFLETYSRDAWHDLGVKEEFVQHNHSRSGRGILRGMHFQTFPGQAKLIRCARGEIFDVIVDMRSNSDTFGQWEGFVLDDKKHRQLLVPVGFGHGFCVTSELADVCYLVSSYYNAEFEAGFDWADPEVAIKWPIDEPQVSERDRNAPAFRAVTGG